MPTPPALWFVGVSHEEVRRFLPRYAAGDLSSADADAVRAHLAGGCAGCLAEVFRHPVGLPVPARRTGRTRARRPALWRHAFRPAIVAAWGLGSIVGVIGVLAFLPAVRMGGRDGGPLVEAERFRAVETARMALTARVERLERERDRAEIEADRQAEAVKAANEASAALRRQLESAAAAPALVEPGAVGPGRQLERLLGSVDARRVFDRLTSLPGVELLRLTAVAPYEEVRGHVLWHPALPDVAVYAFGLPPPPDSALYRVRLVDTDGVVEEAAAFRPAPGGDIALPVRMGGRIGLRTVEVVCDPDATPVLRGSIR